MELSALADLPVAQTPREHNPGMFDLVAAACLAAGFSPKAGPQLGSVQDLLAGPVAAGHCWTVLYARNRPTHYRQRAAIDARPGPYRAHQPRRRRPHRRTLVNYFVTVARTAAPDPA